MSVDNQFVRTAGRLSGECRVLIVGGGMAGLELAKELERHQVDGVLVLDAGPGDDLRHVNVAQPEDAALRAWLEPGADQHFRRPWRSVSTPHYTQASGIRQRVGGRSLYWYGVAMPMEPWALTTPWWPAQVVSDLTVAWQGGDSLYQRIAVMLEEWRGTSLVDEVPDVRIDEWQLSGAPLAVRRGERHPDRWYAYSPLDAWRDPESGQPRRVPVGNEIISGAEVLEILVQQGEANGVVARLAATGELVEVRADVVVLCAGTLVNSRLAATAIGSPARRPVRLGGLFDHIVHGVFLRLAGDQAEKLRAVLPPGWYTAACEPAARSNLYIDVRDREAGDVLLELRVTGEQIPSLENYVDCVPTDNGTWDLIVHAGLSAQDHDIVTAQRRILQQVTDGIAALTGGTSGRLEFGDFHRPQRTNAAVLPEAVRQMTPGVPVTWWSHLGTEDHEGGTLALGTVLDDHHEFRSVQKLYAAGPSTFPRLGAADPSFTTLALAHRLADVLAQRLAD